MKLITLSIAVIAAGLVMCSCSSKAKSTKKAAETSTAETVTTTAQAQTTAAEESVPDEEFTQLPEDAEDELDHISEVASELYPDTKGKKMYGYKGTEEITAEDGTYTCYVFDYYTYKSKTYNKVATIATDTESDEVFVFSDETEAYTAAEFPETEEETESEWYLSETANEEN